MRRQIQQMQRAAARGGRGGMLGGGMPDLSALSEMMQSLSGGGDSDSPGGSMADAMAAVMGGAPGGAGNPMAALQAMMGGSSSSNIRGNNSMMKNHPLAQLMTDPNSAMARCQAIEARPQLICGPGVDRDHDDFSRWTTIYPHYIDATRPLSGGRKLSKEKALAPRPTCEEIAWALTNSLEIRWVIEDKCYPRDYLIRGRIRAEVAPVHLSVDTKPGRIAFLFAVAEAIRERRSEFPATVPKDDRELTTTASNMGKKESDTGKKRSGSGSNIVTSIGVTSSSSAAPCRPSASAGQKAAPKVAGNKAGPKKRTGKKK